MSEGYGNKQKKPNVKFIQPSRVSVFKMPQSLQNFPASILTLVSVYKRQYPTLSYFESKDEPQFYGDVILIARSALCDTGV